MAFFQPGFVPRVQPRRFGFGCTLRTFTDTTLTSNSSSTAWSDLRLVRLRVDPERVLVVLDEAVALLRDDRGDDDLPGIEAHAPATSWIRSSAPSVTSTERAHTSAPTSSSDGSTTRALGEVPEALDERLLVGLRDDEQRELGAPALDASPRRSSSRAPRSRSRRPRRASPAGRDRRARRAERGLPRLAIDLQVVALAAAARTPRRRPSTAAPGSCPRGRGRCPSGATASNDRRRRARGSSRPACRRGRPPPRPGRSRARGAA